MRLQMPRIDEAIEFPRHNRTWHLQQGHGHGFKKMRSDGPGEVNGDGSILPSQPFDFTPCQFWTNLRDFQLHHKPIRWTIHRRIEVNEHFKESHETRFRRVDKRGRFAFRPPLAVAAPLPPHQSTLLAGVFHAQSETSAPRQVAVFQAIQARLDFGHAIDGVEHGKGACATE